MPFARMGVTLDSIVLDKTDLMDIFLLNTLISLVHVAITFPMIVSPFLYP